MPAYPYTEQQAPKAAAMTVDTARQTWIDYRAKLAEAGRYDHQQLITPSLSMQAHYRQLAAEKRLEADEMVADYCKAVTYLTLNRPTLLKALRADYD